MDSFDRRQVRPTMRCMRGTTMRSSGVALAAVIVAACSSPAPVPEGYAFPTWSVGNGGAAALLEGDLEGAGGCLYVRPSFGPRFLVVWPDNLRLVIDNGTPVVMDGREVVARTGAPVRLGGGEIGPSLTPPSAAVCDRTQVWGTNEIVPPG
jgi:hypothetical protein